MADMRGDLRRFIDELEAERERYSTLVEQSKDGIGVVHGDEYIFANDRLAEITGYSREELVGMPYANVIADEDLAGAHEQARRVLEGVAASDQYELDVETKAGQRRRVETTVSKITHDGEPAVLINARDITDRRRREQRLSVFNRLLRHNFRNRLDVIKGHTERLTDQTDGDHAETVLTAADRLATLGTRARRIDRLMARDLKPTTVDVAAVVTDVLDDLDTTEVSVETELPDAVELRTDAETLRTTLSSPLENAVRYADSTVTVAVTTTAAGCQVVISDDGPGIPPTELNSLAAGTETDLQHGRGLGLWQLKWGVDALNGELEFDTADGTTIRITLPALGEAATERDGDAAGDNSVDDDGDGESNDSDNENGSTNESDTDNTDNTDNTDKSDTDSTDS